MTLLNSRVGKILGSFDVNIGEIQVIESEPERAREGHSVPERAREGQREPERAREGQSEPDSEPERLASHLRADGF